MREPRVSAVGAPHLAAARPTTYTTARRGAALLLLLGLLVAALALSLAVGSRPVDLPTVWGALAGRDVPADDEAHRCMPRAHFLS
jgi:iron complex transport system permease protein